METAFSTSARKTEAASSWEFPGPSKADVCLACDGLNSALQTVACSEAESKQIEECLTAIKAWDAHLFSLPGTRKHLLSVLNDLSNAVALLPAKGETATTEAGIKALFKNADEALAEISKDLADRIPDDSRNLHLRNAATVALLVLTIAAFFLVNVLLPGASLLVLAAAALGPTALNFGWGRFSDRIGTADHTDKQLSTLVTAIRNITKQKENELMWKADLARTEAKITDLRNDVNDRLNLQQAEIGALKAMLGAYTRGHTIALSEQNAKLDAIMKHLAISGDASCTGLEAATEGTALATVNSRA